MTLLIEHFDFPAKMNIKTINLLTLGKVSSSSKVESRFPLFIIWCGIPESGLKAEGANLFKVSELLPELVFQTLP